MGRAACNLLTFLHEVRSRNMDQYRTWKSGYNHHAAQRVWPNGNQMTQHLGIPNQIELQRRARRTRKQTSHQGSPSRQYEACSNACETCRHIPYSILNDPAAAEYILYQNTGEPNASVDAGCCLCLFFYRHLDKVFGLLEQLYLEQWQVDHESEDSDVEL